MIIIRRAGAYLVDVFIGVTPWLIYGYFFGERLPGEGGGFRFPIRHAGILGVWAFFLPYCLYMIFAEYFTGRSVGKWIFGLRVTRGDGRKISLGDLIKRHLPDIVELILIPVIAVVCVCVDKCQRRIGDLWAGTLVVDAKGR